MKKYHKKAWRIHCLYGFPLLRQFMLIYVSLKVLAAEMMQKKETDYGVRDPQ